MEPYSAGIKKQGLNPSAVKVMREIVVDISEQSSKTIDELDNKEFDYVITLCENANENCPTFPAKTKIVHRGFDDPPQLAIGTTSEEDALKHYRRVRDEIRDYILTLPAGLKDGHCGPPSTLTKERSRQ